QTCGERGLGRAGGSLGRVGPVSGPRLGGVGPPGRDLAGIALEREASPAEVAHARREPDRRIAAGAADLENLAVPLRRDEREEELPRRSRDSPSPLCRRESKLTLFGILLLQACEHCAHAAADPQP